MKRVALSFSGGKDSNLALYYLLKEGLNVVSLVTTTYKEKGETVAHDEPLNKIENQADELGIPITFIQTDFDSYRVNFIEKLMQLKEEAQIDTIAFGDIYLEGHREWGEQLAHEAGLHAYYPLWDKQENVGKMLQEFVDLGFKADIIKVDEAKLPSHWIGRELDQSFIDDILKRDVCPMGESGEYHTFVSDGPTFKK